MNQPCICDHPQICTRHKQRVYQPDIEACKATGNPGTPSPSRTCRTCQHQGAAILAANGHQVGSAGCGCTGLSRPSGVLWWQCDASGAPVREDRARSCDRYAPA